MLETLRLRVRLPLREYEFQLVTVGRSYGRVRFGAHADPVEPSRRRLGSVGLHGDLEAFGMKGVDERLIQLQQRLTAGAHHIGTRHRAFAPRPEGSDARRQLTRRGELS